MVAYPLEIPGCVVRSIHGDGACIHILADTVSPSAICPSCGAESKHVHSYYERVLLDLPLCKQAVKIRVRAKRFRCQQIDCKRRTFAETLGNLAKRYARRTQRVASAIWHIGQVVGGRAGMRLAHELGIPVSRDQIIRHLRQTEIATTQSVRILGIDDWAKKRGQRYGTILVDLETRRVVDLLPDRDADTVANWLRQHPTVEIVTRDRATEYAKGVAVGAPQARQVADRWHLLKNLTEMTQRALRDEWAQIRKMQAVTQVQTKPFPRSSGDEIQKALNRACRLKRYESVQYLKHKGLSQRRIARLLGFSRGMVRTFYNAAEFPGRQLVSRRSQLDPYLPYLKRRMSTHQVTAKQLWQEILKQGYTGSYRQVSKWVTGYNKEQARTKTRTPPRQLPGRDTCLRLLTSQPETLNEDDSYILGVLRQIPRLEQLYNIVQDFATMAIPRFGGVLKCLKLLV